MTELEHAMEVDPAIKHIKEQVDAAQAMWELKPSETTQQNLKQAESALRAQMEAFRERSRPGGIPRQGFTRQSLARGNKTDNVRTPDAEVHSGGVQHPSDAQPKRSELESDSDGEDSEPDSGRSVSANSMGNEPKRDASPRGNDPNASSSSNPDLGRDDPSRPRLSPTIKQRRTP